MWVLITVWFFLQGVLHCVGSNYCVALLAGGTSLCGFLLRFGFAGKEDFTVWVLITVWFCLQGGLHCIGCNYCLALLVGGTSLCGLLS